MQRYIDLHVHSTASDGTCSPAEDVRLAIEAGLSAFALTDHDTTQGIEEAQNELAAIKEREPDIDLRLIPGIEISVGYKNRDIHILGLFIEPTNEELQKALQESVERRDNRNIEMLERFEKLGIHLTMDDLLEGNPDTVVTRAHFSRALIKKGYVKDAKEAFAKYLDRNAVCYVPRAYIEPEQAVKLIIGAGGIPILAHPLLYDLSLDDINELLSTILVPAGLKGIEVLHSTNKAGDSDILRGLASVYGLMMSGGSDFHGANKPDIKIGVGRGNLRVPETFLNTLKNFMEGK